MMTATGRWMTAVFTAIALCLGVYAGNGDRSALGSGSDTKPVEYGALQGDGTDRSYAITWKNGDGTVIDVTTVAYGRIPTHAGVTKPATGDLRYIFNGWSPTPVPVTGDAVYTATYRERDMGGQGPVCVAHLSFDDYGNDGLNVLKATVGGDAIIRTTPVNVVEGLGAVTCVTDPAILAGLPEGDGAVAIPLRTHLILPIPGELSNVDAHPYSILMKVKFPSFGPYYAIINMPASNDVDDFVFLSNSSTPHIVFKMMGGATSNRIEGRGEGLFKAGEWETLLFLFDRDKTRVLLNGQEIFAYACSLSASRGNCANAGGYFILSGDNDGEDPLIYWADVKVYNGIVDENDGLDRFTVTWNNWDGSTLETDTDVVVNTMPTYDGPTPVKDLGDGVVYHFVGWSPKMNPVASDTVYTAQFVTFEEDGEAAYGRVLLSENFDGETMDPRLTVSTVGSFTAAPGVKEELGVAGTRAFGFGRSTCGSSAFDNYMTTLTVTFDAPTYVASIAFDEMERYGDWGSQGRILVDGTVVDGLTFTKPGSGGYGNSQEADTEFRHRSLTLNMPLTTLSLQVHDITTSSEEFIDNLRIIGGAFKPHVVLWKNHDGTVLEADADLYEGEIPEYDGATPVRMSDEDGDYLFVGWSPQIGPIVSNTVYTAQFVKTTDVIPAIAWRMVANGGKSLGWDLSPAHYTSFGETNTIKVLYRQNAHGKYAEGMMPARTQMRLDGWFFVRREQVRTWSFKQGFDDYMGLAIDDSWIIRNPTYNVMETATWQATEGWHRFTIVCGDISGDYGIYTMNVGWAIAVAIGNASYVGFEDAVIFGDGTFSADYKTVTWKDDDGSVLHVDDHVLTGDWPCYRGERPVKDGFVFTGWDSVLEPVTGDTEYTATYTPFDDYYADYVKIATAEELDAIRANLSTNYVLTADIDLSDAPWTPLGEFRGILDGNGHTISNLTVSQSGTDDVGFFKFLRGATVRNLSFRGGKVEGRHRVGGIFARSYGGNLIENCTADLEVVAYGYEAGGIFGYQNSGVSDAIARCRSLCAVSAYAAEDRAGGLVGKTDGTLSLVDCYATGPVSGFGTSGNVGGLLGLKSSGTAVISNCYHSVRLQGSYLGGDKVGNGDTAATVAGSPTILDCFPKNLVNHRTRGNGSGTVVVVNGEVVAMPDEGSVFIRFEGLPPAEGAFNETTVWAVFGKAVATEEDLRAVTAKGFYKQTADITMSTETPFYGLHYDPMFQGEYDGDGYAIRNLTITANNDYTGLFRRTQGAILKNIHLVGGTVRGRRYVGSLVGWQNAGIVEDCSSSCNVVATDIHGGGLEGVTYANYSTIRRCSASGTVIVYGNYAGGLTSYTNGGETKIYDCYARGDVTANDYAGGFISHGDNIFSISNCYSTGRVKCVSNAGGFNWRDEGAKVVGCFWDEETSARMASGSGVRLSTEMMQSADTYEKWDDGIWRLVDGAYPTFWAAPLPPQLATHVEGVGGGEVTVTDNGDGTFTITATPDEDSFFVRWSGVATTPSPSQGGGDGAVATVTVQPDGNTSVTAIFGMRIRTAAELKAAMANPDRFGHYRLDADIDLENTAARMAVQFNGVFDGNGHEIRNILLSLPTTDDVALFYALRDATVKDLTLRGGKIEARHRAAGIAARLWGGTLIENCTVDLEVTAYGDSAGGVFCWQENALPDQIVRSRSLAAVTSYAAVDRAGGICATSRGTLLLDTCYASGSATGHGTEGRVGGLVAFKESGTLTISNSYHNVRLQGGYLGGDLVGNGDGQATIVGSPTVLDGFPKGVMNLRTRGNGSGTVALVDGEVVATPDEGSAFIRFEGLPPAEGEFNETTVWVVFGKAVATEEDLRAVTAKGFFVQTAEIDMTGSGFIGLHYDPMFQGEYDGAGHGIYGLTIDANNDYTGLFRRTQGAILKNIHLVGGTVKGRRYVGSLVGWQYAGIVEDCSSSCNVVATDIHGGGLEGVTYANYSTIRRCSASGSVIVYGNYAGGLTSYTNGGETKIYDCYARGDVTANDYAGGFISHGDYAFSISNCYSTGRVKCVSNAGGFNWRNEGSKVAECFWDTATSERMTSGCGGGLPTEAMQTASTFANWDTDTWNLVDGAYPTLRGVPAAQVAVQMSGVGGGEVVATDNGDGTFTVTATPDEESFFVRWSGAATAPSQGGGDGAVATMTVCPDGNISVTAIFGRSIRTADELRAVMANPDRFGHYRLDADIDLENTAARMAVQFNGVFDGNGHEIRNILLSLPTTDDVALFYALRDATVKDLTLRGGKIEARNRAAGIAARLWGGTLIENCTVDLEVTAYGDSAGGVFCWQENALPDQVVRSRSLAAVTSYAAVDRAGGICACSRGTLLLDTCYASGSATGHGTEGRVGGLVAFKESGILTISNSYHNVRLQGGYLGGNLVGNGDGQATIVGSPTVLDGFPKGVMNLRTRGNGSGTVALVDGEVVATPDEGSAFIRFEGLPPAEGEFNETTVWAVFGKAVATEEDLRAVTAKGFFVQTAEIDMTGSGFIGLHYDPMFQGEYDGAGHGIYGLTIDANNDYTGLFRRTQGAILKNIRLIGGTVKGRHYVGSLVGWQYAGVVEDCLTTVDVVATGNHGGGLVGVAYANYSTIRRCAAKGNVTISGSYAGGLTSYTNGGGTRIHDCYATGDVTAGSWAGGFISHGDNAFTIENCYSTGKVTAGSNVGGFYFRGDSAEKVVGCFWDRDTSECGVSGLGYGCSTDEMQSAATFAGWSGYDWLIADGGYPELISLMAASETYTVRWEDEDGSLLAEDSNVRMGQTPRYPASVPAKASADGVHYLFDGWSPSVRPTSGDITYRATYREIDKMWMTVDLKTGEVSYQNYDFTTATNVFNTEAYKTTKMAFRLVPRGHYWVQDGLKRGYMANDYYIGMFEVTKAQYALMLNPENTLSDLGNTSLIPQSLVSWENLRGTNGVTAQGCVTNLTGEHAIWKFDQLTGLAFDLPTDAMWEVAARAMPLEDVSHATWPWFFGQTSDSIDLYAWRRSNSGGGNLQPVGQKLPNAWGLYDVYGNVWEWCADGIGDRLWRQTPNADDDPACKYCRGSSSDKDGDRLDLMRSSFINTAYTVGSYQHIGFRLSLIVRNKEPGEHCTVRWVNDDGAELLTDADVEVDAMPSYTGETPTKASDAKYDYAFIGWSPDIEPVADDITFTAVYRAMLRSYTVTWEDEDGTVLEVDRNVAVGRTPRFDGGIPKKAMSDGVVYSFMGWTPEVVPVAGDVTYRATYRASRERTWMTVDLRTGVVGYWDLDFTAATNLFNTEEYKTTKMAFRRVEKGNDYFVQNGAYTANMTNSYYIGLFEVTVAQYALMQNPSAHLANDVASLRSQGYCNRTKVRGIAEAPVAFGEGITAASPLGCLNALVQKANGDGRLVFDLPTEAMWEVAVRAVESGNTAHREWNYHFGADNTDLALYGFMASNNEADAYGFTSGMRVPGCKLPNAWGLYDMYGNARDLCLDGHSGATDNWSLTPYLGDGSYRNWQRDRGGAYNDAVSYTSSTRSYHDSGGYDHNGFRLARICTDDEEISRPIHTVTWLDADGTLLQRDEVVAGGYVRYRGATPTKARDGMTVYTFRGWTPAVSSVVTADATYTAVYEAVDVMLPDDWETAEWTFDESDLSLQSKAIGHGGSTVVHLGVKGPGLLTFTWKVSSEGNYDFLRFYRGESQIAAISGGTDWIVVSNRVDDAGAVTFAWAYTKDGSASSGSDCGWIKEIRWIPDAAGTQVFVCGQSVEFERGADGRTLTATVPAGTETADVRVKVDGIDVSKGFALSVEGTVLNATLLAPFEVPAEAGASNGIWTENGDGTVTLNVTIVPGLYYAVASAASLDGFKCPGAAAPATGETKLTVPKPASDKGFFKVWVSDAPIPPEP